MCALRVLIAGAGLGGLTLAQSMRGTGADVTLFERDSSPWDRPQGYRLHLDADGRSAAREVLSDDLYAVFEATSHSTEPYTTILGLDLSMLKRLPSGDMRDAQVWSGADQPEGHANVDRATLRQILMAALENDVHFGKTLVRYETTADAVVAIFADGSSVEGDVLVGADGIRSAVRRQRAPGCDTVDSGITAIYGRIPLSDAMAVVPCETLSDIFTIASDERKVFLGLGAVEFPMAPVQAVNRYAAGTAMRDQDHYVVCIVGGRHEFFPALSGHQVAHTGAELQQIAVDALADWPAAARVIVEAGDPATFFPVEMYTSVPCALDKPDRVTVLGDAIHAMTPTLGRGANVAMRDGALLGRALKKVLAGRATLPRALAGYEHDMAEYGFAAVTEAALIGQQRMAQNPLPTPGPRDGSGTGTSGTGTT